MTSLCITWHDTTQAITSHQMTWPSHDLTPQQTSRHQNTSLQSTKHHHHGTAEGSFTAKKWFGHRAGRSPCAHSIGKFFLCYIVLFLLETSAPGLSGHYWYNLLLEHLKKYTSMRGCIFTLLKYWNEHLWPMPTSLLFILYLVLAWSSGRPKRRFFTFYGWFFWTICSGNYYNFSKDISFKSLLLMKLKSIGWKQLLTISDQLTQSK